MADEMNTRNKLLADIHKFVRETGIPQTTLGKEVCGDGSLVARLRAGKDITTKNLDRLYAYMAAERAKRGAGGPAVHPPYESHPKAVSAPLWRLWAWLRGSS